MMVIIVWIYMFSDFRKLPSHYQGDCPILDERHCSC